MAKQTLTRRKSKRPCKSMGTKKNQYGGVKKYSNSPNTTKTQHEKQGQVFFSHDGQNYEIELPLKIIRNPEEKKKIIAAEIKKMLSGKNTLIKPLHTSNPRPPSTQRPTSSFRRSRRGSRRGSSSRRTSSPRHSTRVNPSSNIVHTGIININSVTCWFLSSIQLLYTIDELRKYFIQDFDETKIYNPVGTRSSEGQFIEQYSSETVTAFFNVMSLIFKALNSGNTVDLKQIKYNGKTVYNILADDIFGPRNIDFRVLQQDAQEGLNILTDLLSSEPSLDNLFKFNIQEQILCSCQDSNPVNQNNSDQPSINIFPGTVLPLQINYKRGQKKIFNH